MPDSRGGEKDRGGVDLTAPVRRRGEWPTRRTNAIRTVDLRRREGHGATSPEEASTTLNEYLAFGEEMGKRGVLGEASASGHHRRHHVRVRDGEVLTSDGPFAETKEQMAGSISSTARTSTRPSTSRRRSPAPETEASK